MKYFATLLFVLTAILTYSQDNFIPGFYVNNEGDTIKGFINFQDWGNNPKTVEFRLANGEELIITPFEAKGFGIEGAQYKSLMAQYDSDREGKEGIGKYKDPVLKEERLFLKVLINGPISLYALALSGNDKPSLSLYMGMNDTIYYLVYKKYIQYKNEIPYVNVNNKYHGQLKYYLRDCADIGSKIEKIRYTEKSLLKTFVEYYECAGLVPDFVLKKKKPEIEHSIMAGANYRSLDFKYDYNGQNHLIDYESTLSPEIGYSMEIFSTENLGRLSGRYEFSLTYYNFEGSVSTENFLYYKYDYRSLLARNSMAAVYRLSGDKAANWRVYGGGSFYLRAFFKTNYFYTYFDEVRYDGPIEEYDDNIYFDEYQLSKMELGLFAGTLFTKGSWTVDARFEISSGPYSVRSSFTKSKIYSYRAGIAYTLNKR